MRTGFMKHLWFALGIALALAFCLWPGAARAQVVATGGLSGTVVDPSGAAIPGASLTITDPATNFSQTVTANDSGVYTFSDLQPATYQLRVSAKGFGDAIVSSVVIQAAHTANLKVSMKVGAASETVEVSGSSQVLETTTNTLSTTISPEAIQDLPLGGRDALQFAELVPGATYTGQERYTTMDDLPAAALNITVNGTNDNFTRYRSTTTGFFTAAPLRIGAFDEMTVSTSGLSSDAGAEGSTTLQFVTKRGTNKFHGNAFWEAENSFFNANSYTNNAEGEALPKSRLNDYGGSLGGPLWKNKLFFFVNFESETSPSPYTDSTQVFTTGANPATGAMGNAENGDFTYQTTNGNLQTVNLLSIAAANNYPSTVNSVTQGLLTQINNYAKNGTQIAGTTSAFPGAGQCCQLPNTNTLLWAQPFEYKLRYPTARVDYQVTPKISVHESWDLQWFQETGTPNYPGNPLQSDSWKATYFTTTSGFDWILTPHLINQFTFGTESTIEQFNPTTTGDPFASQADEVINPPLSVNSVVPGFILNQPRDAPQRMFTDNLTWTHGDHVFTFGGSVDFATMYETEVDDPPTYSTGIASTDPAINMFNTTNFPNISSANNNVQLGDAESLYAFLTGRISGIGGANYVSSTTNQYQVEGRLIDREAQTYGGIFFQDSWHVNPHLSLNYGLRWEMTGDLYSTNNFWTSPTESGLLGGSTGLFQPGLGPTIELRPHPYNADLHQFAPNLGFAWNPDVEDGFLGKLMGGSRTVIRGSGRVSYYNEGWTTVENSFYTNPGVTQSVFLEPGNLSGQFAPGSLSLGGTIPALNSFPGSFQSAFPLPESDFTFAGQNFDTIDPNIHPPYIESWDFGVQRELPANNVFEMDYVGNHGVHEWLQFDMNEVNIFENGFLPQFKAAQANLVANGGASFADTGAGDTATPIFDTAFAGASSGAFTNSTFINYLNTGQAGALAGALAGNSTYLCNMVGANFSPCGNTGGTYPANFFQVNPYAAGQLAQLLSDPGDSTYNALQVQWKHPTGHGLFLGANYTYSHGLTNRWLGDYYTADEVQYNFTTLRDPQLNKGPSPYDLRNQFKMYYTYDLPFGKNREFRTGYGWADDIIGGWTWGGVISAASGLPFKLMGGTNTYNYSFVTQDNNYPDGSDSGVVLNGVTQSELQSKVGVYPGPSPFIPTVSINPGFLAAHPNAIEPESTPGQLGDFIYLKGPMSWDVDFSLKKAIPIYEHVQFNIFAEFLNAFNHAIWAMPGVTGGPGQPADFMNISNSNYSALGLVNTPRTIEFRLQLAF
ncbi:MAG: carboxypeptidase-like regulatory domain-containing protein [Candidatus Acidiferrales bacterium]